MIMKENLSHVQCFIQFDYFEKIIAQKAKKAIPTKSYQKSVAMAFIAFFNRAERSQYIVFLLGQTAESHLERKKTMNCKFITQDFCFVATL